MRGDALFGGYNFQGSESEKGGSEVAKDGKQQQVKCYLAGFCFRINLKETKTVAWEVHPLGHLVSLIRLLESALEQ